MKKLCLFFAFAAFAACSVPDEELLPATEPDCPVATVTVPDLSDAVTEEVVRSVAARFGAARMTRGGEKTIASVHTLRSEAGDPLCYVVNYADDGGFVVVSASKDYMPVLAFSESGSFDVEAIDRTGVAVWLAEQRVAIEHAAEFPDSIRLRHRAMWMPYDATQEPLVMSGTTRSESDVIALITNSVKQWQAEGYTVYRLSDYKDSPEFQSLPADVQDNLLKLPFGHTNIYYGGVYEVSFVLKKDVYTNTMIEPLLTTKWSQSNGFNQSIPREGLVGCTAIAVGQIMKYHRYPTTYDWNSMYDVQATKTTSDFLYDVGRKIGIVYEMGSSGASISDSESALKAFGYSASKRDHAAADVLFELKNNRPVYMKGKKGAFSNGHAWVCDGASNGTTFREIKLMTLEDCPSTYEPQQFLNPYTKNEIVGYIPTRFHMNWGWGGRYDGYYIDEDIRIHLADGTIRDYREYRRNIVNIYPKNK